MLRSSSSACEVSGAFTNFTYTSEGTTVNMITTFEWKGPYPGTLFSSDDIFGVTWCGPFREISSKGYVTYKNSTYGNPQFRTAEVEDGGLYVSFMTFDKSVTAYYGSLYIGHTVYSGSIQSELKTLTYVPEIVGFSAYGVNTLFLHPSISVSSNDQGISIGYSFGVNIAGYARFDEEISP